MNKNTLTKKEEKAINEQTSFMSLFSMGTVETIYILTFVGIVITLVTIILALKLSLMILLAVAAIVSIFALIVTFLNLRKKAILTKFCYEINELQNKTYNSYKEMETEILNVAKQFVEKHKKWWCDCEEVAEDKVEEILMDNIYLYNEIDIDENIKKDFISERKARIFYYSRNKEDDNYKLFDLAQSLKYAMFGNECDKRHVFICSDKPYEEIDKIDDMAAYVEKILELKEKFDPNMVILDKDTLDVI